MTGTPAGATIPPGRPARFIGSERYRLRAYAPNHPLAIPRVALARDLIGAYGAITPAEEVPAREATDFELAWFHDRAYVAAIKRAEQLGRVRQAHRAAFALGTLENPYFDHFFSTPATAAGASIQAAEEVLAGRVAFNPAGGMHHARPGRAQGFCYFNDPVLAVLQAAPRGLARALRGHRCAPLRRRGGDLPR
ncbi:MAG: hypothetical protein M5U08_12305 [Burkholderiales bacterium]|nr:hypothetical protein [Burkholderiales bacterium]